VSFTTKLLANYKQQLAMAEEEPSQPELLTEADESEGTFHSLGFLK